MQFINKLCSKKTLPPTEYSDLMHYLLLDMNVNFGPNDYKNSEECIRTPYIKDELILMGLVKALKKIDSLEEEMLELKKELQLV